MSSDNVANAEAKTSKIYDRCIENALVKTGSGLLMAGLGSVLFFRSPVARSSVTFFGGGMGAGVAWMDCRLSIEQPQFKLSAFKLPGFAQTRMRSISDKVQHKEEKAPKQEEKEHNKEEPKHEEAKKEEHPPAKEASEKH